MIINIDYEEWKPETYKGVEVWNGQFLVKKIFTGRVEEDLEDAEQYAKQTGKEIFYTSSVDHYIMDIINRSARVGKENGLLSNL